MNDKEKKKEIGLFLDRKTEELVSYGVDKTRALLFLGLFAFELMNICAKQKEDKK